MQKCNNINEIINKIREMDYYKEICIAELTCYNPETNFVEPMDQMKSMFIISVKR